MWPLPFFITVLNVKFGEVLPFRQSTWYHYGSKSCFTFISSTTVHNGTEENNLVATVMDEHPKDLGTGSLASKNWGEFSQCGQQLCTAAWLCGAANAQRDTQDGVQDPRLHRPVAVEMSEQRSEPRSVGAGTCTDISVWKRRLRKAQTSYPAYF